MTVGAVAWYLMKQWREETERWQRDHEKYEAYWSEENRRREYVPRHAAPELDNSSPGVTSWC